jgi:hypothetical protein
MDLSKAFDCLPHDILLDKLSAYGMFTDSVSPLESYLSNRKQQIKINGILSSWSDIQTKYCHPHNYIKYPFNKIKNIINKDIKK